jgi:hypothetical protein
MGPIANTFKMMKSHVKILILGSLMFLQASPAPAQELGNWTLSQTKSPDGTTVFAASLNASNLISAGSGPDYAPLYSISCKQGDAAHWSQTLTFEDGVSGSGEIELSAKVDAKAPREEMWKIGAKNRILTRENTPDIAELRTARNLKFTWSWGWSWLWLSDKAKFELGEVEAVVFTLAKSCGIAEP